MRVLILCYEFPPLGGGGAKVVAGLSRQLVLDGHEVDILTSGWKDLPPKETIAGAIVHRVRTIRGRADRTSPLELAAYAISVIPTLRRLLRERSYDVCNCHFIFPDGVLIPLMKRWSDIPIVLTAHGSDVPGYNPERFRLLHAVLAPLWNWVVDRADLIVCPSPTLRRLIVSRRPKARTVIIPNGFDPARFKPSSERVPRILAVSRLFRRKGIQDLIEAFAGLDTPYELDIVGDGPNRQALEKQARASKAPIRFRGWLDNDSPDLKALFETSSVFALPSTAENFPVSLLEAMASGTAIVTTKGTGCADVTGDTALLVEPGDVDGLRAALVRLTTDKALRARLGEAGRLRLQQNFTWSHVAVQYVDAFRRASPDRPPSAALSR
ncbi:glycosyltransferase family 4 protein [Oceanibacterium hippocampi]|uniref:Glycogen synthase n=1 Tax=Oceanibacterium hippocampi TaxID=745714 RepID=A0A1Y5TH10_9PROT|nr:glycosyltransferase family 4 protein [Oceanibacterium hippocampi]SLN61836.1 Glycogen synthase [Oceanibacterium hippocampi]